MPKIDCGEFEITIEKRTVTPVMAQGLLKNQIKNRHYIRSSVNRIRKEIEAGTFRLNGETIILDTMGRLLDGQHRLMAVAESQKTIETLVVSGIPTPYMETIDMGRSRNVRDLFQLNDIAHASITAAICRYLCSWDMHQEKIKEKLFWSRSQLDIQPHLILNYYRTHQTFIDTIRSMFIANTPIIKKIGAQHLCVAFAILRRINKPLSIEFSDALITGQIPPRWEIITPLRDELLSHEFANEKFNTVDKCSLLFGAWNCVIDETPLSITGNYFSYPKEG